MRVAYRAGVPVSTIAEICGVTENEVKEGIVSVNDEQRSDQDSIPHSEDNHASEHDAGTPDGVSVSSDESAASTAVPVNTEDKSTPVRDDDDAPDLSGLSDGELTEQATALRQAGNADEAAHYDRELESRQNN